MMKILAISSSPRRGGNSERMLDVAVAAAGETGAEVEKVILKEIGFFPCANCGACSRTGRCVLKDSYAELNGKIRAADRIIIAAPIYFGSICAQLKSLIDRGQPFWVEKFLLKREPEPREVQRRGIFLSCCGFAQGQKFFANAEEIVRTYYFCMDVPYGGGVFEAGVDDRGAIDQHPEALERCRQAGRNLAR